MNVGPSCSLDDLRIRRVHVAVEDVLLDCPGEQENILLDDANCPAQRSERHIPDIHTVNRNSPGRHVVEPRDEIAHGCLARSRGSHERHGFPRRDLQIDVPQDVRFVVVGERHLPELDPALDIGQLAGLGRVADFGSLIHDLGEPFEAAHAPLELLCEVGQAADRLQNKSYVEDERHKVTNPDDFEVDQHAAISDHGNVEEVGEKSHAGHESTHPPVGEVLGLLEERVRLLKLGDLVIFVGKRLDDPVAGDTVLQLGVHVRDFLPHLSECRLHRSPLGNGKPHHQRDERRHCQGQTPLDGKQYCQ